MVGKLAPNSSHLTRGWVKYVFGWGYFRTVPSQNGDEIVTSPPLPIVERVMRRISVKRRIPSLEMVGVMKGRHDSMLFTYHVRLKT